ncbi:MAG: ROK family protein, partial [Anaerolineae bacterium]|nr:ROK family protein [Anaerolineae bacterium]
MSEVIIGVDLGGTQIRAARLDRQLNILDRKAILTEAIHGPDHVIARMVGLIREVLPAPETKVVGIGVSSPGPLNPMTGMVVDPPNLHGWTRVPLVQRLQDALDLPVFIGNDASVAVLAEVARGAAQGAKHAIYITLSTGIGGGVLVDGRLLLGQQGYAAHIGHMSMVVEGEKITSLEKEAAGPSLARQARDAIMQGRD